MTKLGICGAHRTGKTTLAIALSEKLNIPFIPIGTSEIFAKYKLNPAKPMELISRLSIQQEILAHAESIWSEVDEPSFICDRTPIDMMAYTLAEIQGHTLTGSLEKELAGYLYDCERVTKKYFQHLILVPPAIPIIDEIGKASPSRGYIHHVHLLCYALLNTSVVQNRFVLKEKITDLDDRVKNIESFLEQNR